MAIFDEGLNMMVLGLAFVFAGIPILAKCLRDHRHPTPHQSGLLTRGSKSVHQLLVGTFIALFSLTSLTPAVAEGLFSLPTKDGLEFYQLPTQLKTVPVIPQEASQFLAPVFHEKPLHSEFQMGRINHVVLTSDRIHPGFIVTPSGRILTINGKIDWEGNEAPSLVAQQFENPQRISRNIGVSLEDSQVALRANILTHSNEKN